MLWKLEGLSEHDVRRPVTPTGTTFAENDLDAVGHVAHWGNEAVTLHQILVHVATETHHHAGHADIVRETIDGAAGLRAGNSNLPDDGYDWAAYHARVEAAARAAGEQA